jgi:hypothetical protein
VSDVLADLQEVLTEGRVYPVGSLVQYKTPQGKEAFGVALDTTGNEVWVVSAYDPTLEKDLVRRAYRDPVTLRMKKVLRKYKGVRMDIHRVPINKTRLMGRMRGKDLRLYRNLAVELDKARL